MRNGWITTEIHLACALRYFAGGSYLDITLSHGIGKTDLYCSIWAVIHATNAWTTLQFSFPTMSAECESIASEFSHRSKAGFCNCIGCINGMLVSVVLTMGNSTVKERQIRSELTSCLRC